MRHLRALSLSLLALGLMPSCETVGNTAWREAGMSQPRVIPVTLTPGTELEVLFFYTPELDSEVTVRPDGRISLMLLGDVDAAGLTPGELQTNLTELYRPHLKQPTLSVVVKSLGNQQVLVGGQVLRPGSIPMPGGMTALDALMLAGGPDTRLGNVRNVIVIREQDGERRGYALDMRGALTGQLSEPFYLAPKDVVYVPRTRISSVNQWIDQHLNQIIPQLGITYTRPVGEGTIGIDTRSSF